MKPQPTGRPEGVNPPHGVTDAECFEAIRHSDRIWREFVQNQGGATTTDSINVQWLCGYVTRLQSELGAANAKLVRVREAAEQIQKAHDSAATYDEMVAAQADAATDVLAILDEPEDRGGVEVKRTEDREQGGRGEGDAAPLR
jgi:hypothetical protein